MGLCSASEHYYLCSIGMGLLTVLSVTCAFVLFLSLFLGLCFLRDLCLNWRAARIQRNVPEDPPISHFIVPSDGGRVYTVHANGEITPDISHLCRRGMND